jgi:tetratricopeptide (TPR) repeat protein/tRNA A-37 threonylcarbamoyl transferase component Bud32
MADQAAPPDPPHPETHLTATRDPSNASNAPELQFRVIPESIGDYRILALLGEGGMGTVYKAEQLHPQRIVALKVIRPGLSNEKVLRRFKREAEALGRLQHPGIAQIYEAGTADSGLGPQPYFAMEFIQGERLREYAMDGRLTTPERLALMVQVCDAVHHAHLRGIIHRDLKPGNILVDTNGRVKVLDFGVALLTDSDAHATRQTDLGQLVGTLAYMSPEQVVADSQGLDIRSDVYALGVILYELLASKMPYATQGRAMHEVVQAIREEEPAPLSAIHTSYRGDIDTIVTKALEKDKTRRYASAAELAGDIRRYLADEPITARPPSAAYQVGKFARRHKTLVAGIASVFLALVIGVVASTREAVRAHKAELAAEEQRKRADQEATAARAVIDFLQNDLLAQASASNQSSKPDPELKVRTALDRAAARIHGRFEQQPELEAAIQDTIGRTYYQLGLYAEARKQLERALELYRRTLGEENPKTLTTMSRLGRAAWLQADYQEAGTLLSRAVEVQRRVLSTNNPDTLYSMNNLANVYRAQGKDSEAEALYSQTLEIRRRVLGPEHPDTLSSTNNLANVYWSQGKYAEAETLYRQAMTTQSRVLGPEHPDTLLSMGNLADTLAKQGKYAESETLFAQVIEVSRRVMGRDHPRTLGFLSDSGTMYQRQGKFALAEANIKDALAGRRRTLGSNHPETMEGAADLALALLSQGKFVESERLAREALEFNRKKSPEDWPRFRAESLLGASLSGQKKYREAEPLLIGSYRAMVERKEKPGWMGASTARHLDEARGWIVQLYQAWGKPEKAAEWGKS